MPASNEDKLPSYEDTSLIAKCHCGGITIVVPAPPTLINECQCSLCFRYGANWAYYPAQEVLVTAEADRKHMEYVRDDAGCSRDIVFSFCSNCGCLTHWKSVVGGNSKKMGVNVRMLPVEVTKDVKRQYGNG